MVATISVNDIRGQIDFGIITMREDEFGAVLKRFPRKWLARSERHYNISEFSTADGTTYYAAIVRTYRQGESDAQHAASHLINELDPTCLVLVGIGGAKPESEFTLGDVVVATHLHDFCVYAAEPGGKTTTTNQGGPMHSLIQVAVANLRAEEDSLGPWNTQEAIGGPQPPVDLSEENFTGDDPKWKKKVRTALAHHFESCGPDRKPIVTAAAVASSGALMKDPQLFQNWLGHARDLKAVEMELAGVYGAARSVRGDRPVLAIRGISDVVGFERHPSWTDYACRSAASFARAYLTSGLLDFSPKAKQQAPSEVVPPSTVRLLSCKVSQLEPYYHANLYVILENQGNEHVKIRAIRFYVVKTWDIIQCQTSRLQPTGAPPLPRINIPPEPDAEVKLLINEVIRPHARLDLQLNLYSSDAKNRLEGALTASPVYGVYVFQLIPTVETSEGDLELPPILVNLNGFAMFSEYRISITQRQQDALVDAANEAIATIESGALADPILKNDLASVLAHGNGSISPRRDNP